MVCDLAPRFRHYVRSAVFINYIECSLISTQFDIGVIVISPENSIHSYGCYYLLFLFSVTRITGHTGNAFNRMTSTVSRMKYNPELMRILLFPFVTGNANSDM